MSSVGSVSTDMPLPGSPTAISRGGGWDSTRHVMFSGSRQGQLKIVMTSAPLGMSVALVLGPLLAYYLWREPLTS
jgi:hypothetical protein